MPTEEGRRAGDEGDEEADEWLERLISEGRG